MKKLLFIVVTIAAAVLAGCSSQPSSVELKEISLSKQKLTLEVGESKQLVVIYEPEAAEDGAPEVVWESSKEKVAKINQNGKVTAEAIGKATITATCGKLTAECEVEVVKATNPSNPENPENPENPDPATTLSLSRNNIDVPAAGGVYNIEITSNTMWSASVDAEWVTLSSNSGTGNGDIEVTVAAATEVKITTATITFTYGTSDKETLSISRAQRAGKPITLDIERKIVAMKGEFFTINVTSELEWTAESSNEKMVKLSNKTEKSIDVAVSDNSSAPVQGTDVVYHPTSTIVFSNGESTATFEIYQQHPYVYLYVYWGVQEKPAAGGTYSAKLYSNTTWNMYFSGDYSWAHLTPMSGSGDATLSLVIDKNTTGKARECRVHLYSGDYGYGIYQAGN